MTIANNLEDGRPGLVSKESGTLEQRLRDYAANGCRAWIGIEAIFIEAADALAQKDRALKLFADMADEADAWGQDGQAVYMANCLSIGDLHAARAALAKASAS